MNDCIVKFLLTTPHPSPRKRAHLARIAQATPLTSCRLKDNYSNVACATGGKQGGEFSFLFLGRDKVVAHNNHLFDFAVWNVFADDDCVPMVFVAIVPRKNRLVLVAQNED